MMVATKKACFDLMGDDILELSTGKETLKNKIGSFDEKLFEESKAKLLKQIEYEKKAVLVMSRIQKQKDKHQLNGIY